MKNDFSGTWVADLSQSKLRGAVPTALTICIEHSNDTLKEEVIILTPEKGERRSVLQCHIGVQPGHSTLDGTLVRGGAKWDEEELVIDLWVEAGGRELHLCDYWSLSNDGQVLTMEHRNDDLAGQKTVLRRSE